MTSSEVVEFIRERIAESMEPDQVRYDLSMQAVRPERSFTVL